MYAHNRPIFFGHGVIEGESWEPARNRKWMKLMKRGILDKKRESCTPPTHEQLVNDAGAIAQVRDAWEAGRKAGTRRPELSWFQVGDVEILM